MRKTAKMHVKFIVILEPFFSLKLVNVIVYILMHGLCKFPASKQPVNEMHRIVQNCVPSVLFSKFHPELFLFEINI